MKKYFYWPYVVISLPTNICLWVIVKILCFLLGTTLVVGNLLERVEWWICNCHDAWNAKSPFSPFRVTIPSVFKNVFKVGYK